MKGCVNLRNLMKICLLLDWQHCLKYLISNLFTGPTFAFYHWFVHSLHQTLFEFQVLQPSCTTLQRPSRSTMLMRYPSSLKQNVSIQFYRVAMSHRLRMREPQMKVLSRGKLEKNGFSTFEQAHDILSKIVFKNW